MRIIDGHGNKITDIIEEINIAIKQNTTIFKVITGYGSKVDGVCKTKNKVLNYLEDLKEKNLVTEYIVGSEIKSLSGKYYKLIKNEPKFIDIFKQEKDTNEGIIYIIK